jgi:hypothetical protein
MRTGTENYGATGRLHLVVLLQARAIVVPSHHRPHLAWLLCTRANGGTGTGVTQYLHALLSLHLETTIRVLGMHGSLGGAWGDFYAGGVLVGGSVVGNGAAGEGERVVVDTRYDHVSSSLTVTLSDRLEVLSLHGTGSYVPRAPSRTASSVSSLASSGYRRNSGSVMVKKAVRFKLLRSVGGSEIMGMDMWVRQEVS